MRVKGPVPGDRVVVVGVDQGPVDVEDRRWLPPLRTGTRMEMAATRPVRVGCSGLELPRLARRPLPEGASERAMARALRRGLRHGRGQRDLLPAAEAGDRRRAGWTRRPEGFLFAVKASRYLTHIRRLRDIAEGVARFWEPLEPLRAAGRWARCSGSSPRASTVTTTSSRPPSSPAPRPPLLRVPPPELVRGRRCGICWSERGASLVIARRCPARPAAARPLGELVYLRLHYGARGRDGNYSPAELESLAPPHRRLALAPRGVRLLQQRLAWLRARQRPRVAGRSLPVRGGTP